MVGVLKLLKKVYLAPGIYFLFIFMISHRDKIVDKLSLTNFLLAFLLKAHLVNIWILQIHARIITYSRYHKDTEPLYNYFMCSLVSPFFSVSIHYFNAFIAFYIRCKNYRKMSFHIFGTPPYWPAGYQKSGLSCSHALGFSKLGSISYNLIAFLAF